MSRVGIFVFLCEGKGGLAGANWACQRQAPTRGYRLGRAFCSRRCTALTCMLLIFGWGNSGLAGANWACQRQAPTRGYRLGRAFCSRRCTALTCVLLTFGWGKGLLADANWAGRAQPLREATPRGAYFLASFLVSQSRGLSSVYRKKRESGRSIWKKSSTFKRCCHRKWALAFQLPLRRWS